MLTLLLIILAAGAGGVLYMRRRGAGSQSMSVAARLGRFGLAAPVTGDVSNLIAPGAPVAPQPVRDEHQSAVSRSMEHLVERGPMANFIFRKLDQANLKMTPSEFVSFALAGFVIAMLIGLVIRGALGLFVLGVAALVAPWIYLNMRAKRRRKQFMEQLADMAQMMGNSMRAGFSILQSMELVATEGVQPAAGEFERVVTEVKLGLPLDQALEHLLERMPGEDVALMVVAINVQRQIGGNLAEILMVISQTIRERVRFQRDLRALTAQARYSSYIITALPVAVGVVINLIDRSYESYLYTSDLGHVMIAAAVFMLALGFFFLNRIANIEV